MRVSNDSLSQQLLAAQALWHKAAGSQWGPNGRKRFLSQERLRIPLGHQMTSDLHHCRPHQLAPRSRPTMRDRWWCLASWLNSEGATKTRIEHVKKGVKLQLQGKFHTLPLPPPSSSFGHGQSSQSSASKVHC